MNTIILGLIVFAVFLLLIIVTGIPISFGLGLTSIGGVFLLLGGSEALTIVSNTAWDAVSGFAFTCIPLYVFMGTLISTTGLGTKLYGSMAKWLSWLPGGLAVASTGSCGIFAAISGSSVATAAVMSKIAVPAMREVRYDDAFSTGAIAAGGTLGIIIPPSIPMIVYGISTKTSIGELFIAGVIPGIILVFFFMTLQVIQAKLGSAPAERVRFTWAERVHSLKDICPFALLIICILGSIYAGIATPTEAAAVGVAVTILLGLFYRVMTFEKLYVSLKNATRTSAMILMVIMGAMLFGYLLTAINFPQTLVDLATSGGVSRWWILLAMSLIFLFLGCFLETISIIVICAPICTPIIILLGWDPIWFGVLMVINMEMALITPPVGLNIYVVQDAVKSFGITAATIIRGVVPYLFVMAFVILLVAIFPDLALWLPRKMG